MTKTRAPHSSARTKAVPAIVSLTVNNIRSSLFFSLKPSFRDYSRHIAMRPARVESHTLEEGAAAQTDHEAQDRAQPSAGDHHRPKTTDPFFSIRACPPGLPRRLRSLGPSTSVGLKRTRERHPPWRPPRGDDPSRTGPPGKHKPIPFDAAKSTANSHPNPAKIRFRYTGGQDRIPRLEISLSRS